jgi:PAS domain S-box-containing protein
LHVERLAAPPPATTLFLATTSRSAGATLKPSRDFRHMVRVGGQFPSSGNPLRSPNELAKELHWRSDELETLNEELRSLNDELAVAEATHRGIRRAAKRADTKLRQVIDTAARPFILCDSDDVVVLWNRAAAIRYGLSSMQAVGSDLFAVVPSLDNRPLRDACFKAAGRRKPGTWRVTQKGRQYLVDTVPSEAGKRRHYLLRVGSTAF